LLCTLVKEPLGWGVNKSGERQEAKSKAEEKWHRYTKKKSRKGEKGRRLATAKIIHEDAFEGEVTTNTFRQRKAKHLSWDGESAQVEEKERSKLSRRQQ